VETFIYPVLRRAAALLVRLWCPLSRRYSGFLDNMPKLAYNVPMKKKKPPSQPKHQVQEVQINSNDEKEVAPGHPDRKETTQRNHRTPQEE